MGEREDMVTHEEIEATKKATAWTDDDRNRVDDAARTALSVAEAKAEVPVWFGAFVPGSLFQANGWWCRVKTFVGDGEGTIFVAIDPEKPTRKAQKRKAK